ncbi:MAG TPA: DUF5818 domain-containing protein [Verrucomicrobiae bacterium]|nr:DUF5818 domain-containing protein [Verrucomicrobiae bacterium]
MVERCSSIIVLALLIVSAAIGVSAGSNDQVFKGEIGDSQCALNVHSLSRSHREMLERKSIGKTSADCARYCVKNLGGVFVLQVKDKVYKLDNQELADKNAGLKVEVVGVLDPKSNVIAVTSIEPLR